MKNDHKQTSVANHLLVLYLPPPLERVSTFCPAANTELLENKIDCAIRYCGCGGKKKLFAM